MNLKTKAFMRLVSLSAKQESTRLARLEKTINASEQQKRLT
jgi:uncharacterized protein YdeI (YjbR/CyaY-like superfamily)